MYTRPYKLTRILESEAISYAVISGTLDECGHVERVAATGKLLDTEYDVRVGVLSADRFLGDGKPKPIAFLDPSTTTVSRGAQSVRRCQGFST